MSDRYQTNKKNNSKSTKALFSIVCLCIIGLGMVVYFGTNTQPQNDTVNEPQTLEVATEAQHAVTVTETTAAPPSTEAAEESTAPERSDSVATSMPQGEGNTPYKSYYEYPLGEAVVKGYSENPVKSETMGDYRAHAGVDFKGDEGANVCAINAGVIMNIYYDNLYGGVVEIDHGGQLVARYCGLDTISVKMGDAVEIGDILGSLGKVPVESADGFHLHLETKLDGESVNPLEVMGKTE
ncbi:MAG: M23 family metallopeptidase [Eubacterium sp.]|nr:M23 family metallopeptidase [Eubacterium sp.]